MEFTNKIRFSLEEFFIESGMDYLPQEEDKNCFILEMKDIDVRTETNIMMVQANEIGYVINCIPYDFNMREEHKLELAEYCSRVNLLLCVGGAFAMDFDNNVLFFRKIVNCMGSDNHLLSSEKFEMDFLVSVAVYEQFLDGALMVNYGVMNPKDAFNLMLNSLE